MAAAPTIEDARRIAREVAGDDDRVARVLVFGSVARGAAEPLSDLDLVVLLDLAASSAKERSEAREQVARAVRRRSLWPCDVVVRTSPQWEHLTRNVSASFAAGIRGDAVEVFARSGRSAPIAVSGSVAGVAHDNMDIASNRLVDATEELKAIRDRVHLIHTDEEWITGHAAEGIEDEDDSRAMRYRWCLSTSHLTIELAVKAMVAAEGTSPERIHSIDGLIRAIKDRATIQRIESSVDAIREPDGRIRNWRMGVYAAGDEAENGDGWQAALTPHHAASYITAAVAALHQAADVLEETPSRPRHGSRIAKARLIADEVARIGVTSEILENGIRPEPPTTRGQTGGGAAPQPSPRKVERPRISDKLRRRLLLKDKIKAAHARTPSETDAEIARKTGASRRYARKIRSRLSR